MKFGEQEPSGAEEARLEQIRERLTQAVPLVRDFEELFALLKDANPPSIFYSIEEIIGKIEDFREFRKNADRDAYIEESLLRNIPVVFGIQKKVLELIEVELTQK